MFILCEALRIQVLSVLTTFYLGEKTDKRQDMLCVRLNGVRRGFREIRNVRTGVVTVHTSVAGKASRMGLRWQKL